MISSNTPINTDMYKQRIQMDYLFMAFVTSFPVLHPKLHLLKLSALVVRILYVANEVDALGVSSYNPA